MTDWRADARLPLLESRRHDETQETAHRRRPYASPPSVFVTTLGEILPPSRVIPQKQQASLGLVDSQGRQGLRLWCVGDTTLVARPCVAIVGTRKVSSDGARRARKLGRQLAEAGVVVVSGLAKGVDTEALTAAISAGGHVVAVIGTPLERAYPAENKALQERIYQEHLLVSQFAPGSRVFPTNFPTRNKLMAAISDATVIIEASDTSGTLSQASECEQLGRWLFIAKSVLEDPSLSWPTKFHGPKTRALTATKDVLEALTIR